jgi:alkaline phosphatase D
VHSGDTIYADGPIRSEVKLPDGTVWKNITTEAKSKVAETLDEFRGNYKYNLLDAHQRKFAASTVQLWQWDDHEVMNNWSPSTDLTNDDRYREKDIRKLAARARQAFLEYAPIRVDRSARIHRVISNGPLLDVFLLDMRSYRGPNNYNRQETESPDTAYLGNAQIQWFIDAMGRSKATWKIIAADMPLSLIVGDGKDREGRPKFENSANGDGPPLGRELEIARILRAFQCGKVRNTIWITADTHYTAAHLFDPSKAQFTKFDPFWEFVSGPMNAGTFGPNAVDNTFGMQVAFQKAPPKGQANLPPSAGLQFFGEINVEARTRELSVILRDISGAALFQKSFGPQ